jgi:heme ABC exporter ATP-binding subunit CcmA
VTAPLLEARGLARTFGARTVLHGLDLTLAEGDTLAVVGPNGAGKTTLLRCLAGLMRPSAGRVLLDGYQVSGRDPASRRAVGLLSHRPMLYDDLTLRENLEFAGRLHQLPDPSAAAHAALVSVGLEARAGDSPRTLSRGLLQRAALARALLHRPRLLLLDEPFTGLDAAAAERLRRLLQERRPARLGTIVVTHQVAEVWDLATRVAALVDGRWSMVADRREAGSSEAWDREADRFLARYREAIPA